MIGIDANVLVRYFAQDDSVQGPLAKRLLQRDLTEQAPGHVSLVSLAKTIWVLRSRYRATREEIISALETLLVAPQLKVQDAAAVWQALDDFQQSGVGAADTLIAAVNRLHGCSHTVTFDEKATRITGMKLLS